jgi:hypothetical protein
VTPAGFSVERLLPIVTDENLQKFLERNCHHLSVTKLPDEWKAWIGFVVESARVYNGCLSIEDGVLYLCQIMRVFERLYENQAYDGITEGELHSKFFSGLILCRYPYPGHASVVFGQALRNAEDRFITSKNVENWHPEMASGTGWERYYKLTLAGELLADSANDEPEANGSSAVATHTQTAAIKAGMPTTADIRNDDSQLSQRVEPKGSRQTDRKADEKQEKKTRVLSDAARACGRAYQRAIANGDKRTRKEFCQAWIAEHGNKYKSANNRAPSWRTIDKALQDHPEAWKQTPDRADKSTDADV